MIDTQTKEEVLIEVLPYIQKYEGKTFVIKYGGAAMDDPDLKRTFAKDVTLLRKIGINIVIVHGGGKEITGLSTALGLETKWVDGHRFTDEQHLAVVTMVLAGKVNKEIVRSINVNGGNAVGLSGIDNDLLLTQRYRPNGQDLGFVGQVVRVNTAFLGMLLDQGIVPVIAPVGTDGESEIHNINADLAAGAIASALMAEKLVYLSDIEGVRVSDKLVSTLTESTSRKHINEGTISGGMVPKVRSAFATLNAGVKKVHIIDGRVKHSLLLEIFTDEGVGTQMVKEQDERTHPGDQP